MLYDKETRGREQQTNSLRFTLVHPSYFSLSLSGYQNDEGKKEKETGAPVARAGVYIYIYSIRVFKDDSGVVYPVTKG